MTDYISALHDNGAKIYIVGGAVRQYLFNSIHQTNISIKDYDYLVCELEQSKIIEILQNFGKIKEVGQSFGIILFNPFNTKENIEFALPRTEISTGSGYKDFIIQSDPYLSLYQDFSRRDATINAIGFQIYSINDILFLDHLEYPEPNLTNFIDPFNGIDNIRRKIWKAIGDPYQRFLEDPVRIMRAFRQSTELSLEIELNTLNAIIAHYDIMKSLIPNSYVRLFNEFFKIVNVQISGKYLMLMSNIGILNFLGFDSKIDNDVSDKLDKSNKIIKIALILDLINFNTNIKKWVYDRQLLATSLFTQSDLYVLIAIQMFSSEVKNIFDIECCIGTLQYKLLKIREHIYKFAKIESTYVLSQVMEYIKISYDLNISVDYIINEYINTNVMSTDQLVISGDILQKTFNLKGKQIGEAKKMILNEIFLGKLSNEHTKILEYVNNIYNILINEQA